MKKAQIENDEKIEKLKILFAKIGQIKIDPKIENAKKMDKVEKFDFKRDKIKNTEEIGQN